MNEGDTVRAGKRSVLSFQTDRVHRRVHKQPNLIVRCRVAAFREFLHSAPRDRVVDTTEMTNNDGRGLLHGWFNDATVHV